MDNLMCALAATGYGVLSGHLETSKRFEAVRERERESLSSEGVCPVTLNVAVKRR